MYNRTDEGKVIDPPIIPEWERKIYSAMESGADPDELQELSEEYEQERTELADKRDERERKRNQKDEDRYLEMRQRQSEESFYTKTLPPTGPMGQRVEVDE